MPSRVTQRGPPPLSVHAFLPTVEASAPLPSQFNTARHSPVTSAEYTLQQTGFDIVRLDGHATEPFLLVQVLVRGERCPLVGRITMDMSLTDVTELRGNVELGDEQLDEFLPNLRMLPKKRKAFLQGRVPLHHLVARRLL